MTEATAKGDSMGLTANWLAEATQEAGLRTTSGGTTSNTDACYVGDPLYEPTRIYPSYYTPNYYGHYIPTWGKTLNPVKLKMSEVEKLRAAAKKSPDIKKILEKFTDYIEVKVDFP